ncbi:MAG: alpha/beta hydrolase [Burkholderiaceae bacterium]|jgi:pimeloyl-ACP methyl ester carboxylesterase|nr:alpha/beta hydrolase [Burkholderiaceae bacterium]
MYQPLRSSRSEFLTVRGLRTHVRSWGALGDGAPPLVLVHGWMDTSASWQFMVDALDDSFWTGRRIIAPDWRGFGLSMAEDKARDHYDFVEYLADLDALLDYCAGAGPVDLVGHSMGGNVAMMYAGARPTRIRRLVNLEGFGMPAAQPEQAPGRLAQWLDQLKDLRAGRLALKTYADAAGVAARLMKNNPRLPQDKADWLARHWAVPRAPADDGKSAATTRWTVLGEAAHRVVNPHLFRVDEMLAIYRTISAPTLMVEASDDSLAGFWGARYTQAEFHARLPAVSDLHRETLPDCGHMLHHDQPERLARLLEAFLTA